MIKRISYKIDDSVLQVELPPFTVSLVLEAQVWKYTLTMKNGKPLPFSL